MKKFMLSCSLISTFFMISCNNKTDESKSDNSSNPLMTASTLPYQAIPFDKIKTEHLKPAIEAGMKENLAEIEAIANNSEAPTFENTLVAMEKSGQLLRRASSAFGVLASANTNDDLQKVKEELAPKFAAHDDAIFLNTKLYQRVETLYQSRQNLGLDPESLRLLEYYKQKFELSGAKLNDEQKTALKKLNEEEASLSAKFSNQLLSAGKKAAVMIENKDEIAGLSESDVAAIAENGKWKIPIQNTTQQPLLAQLTDRATRAKLFDASWNRAERGDENDTRAVLTKLAKIRADKAQLMGFNNYATWKLSDQMAVTPAAVNKFFAQLIPAATAKARLEAEDIQALIKSKGDTFNLQAYDWDFYAEQVRKAKYDLDESQIKPYFVLDSVLKNGVFYAATQLYGITFKQRTDLPVYHEDVKVYELFEENGSPLGLFYCDYFKRDSKNGGAWMDNMVGQSKLMNTKPVIYNVCNYTKPAKGQPALISFDDVTTLFHEFGHALHGFFANQQYPSLSGTNVARDFVEFPSQFNENWALYPSVLKNYALHYKTGAPIPDDLVNKIKNAATFNQGYAFTEIIAAADLDLQWHSLPPSAPIQNADTFETNALIKSKLNLSYVPPRYRSSYFSHIWGGGYGAGYYAYLWTEMLHHDSYQWFEENGGLTRANGQRFREMILSKGNTEDYNTMYKNFRGKAPVIEPMLKSRGLK